MNFMFVTLLVSQLPMSWLKAGLNYRTGRHGLPRGVSVDGGGGDMRRWGINAATSRERQYVRRTWTPC